MKTVSKHLICTALVVMMLGGLTFTRKVSAQAEMPTGTAYATVEQLKEMTVKSGAKISFGAYTWYPAGWDRGVYDDAGTISAGLVLLGDPWCDFGLTKYDNDPKAAIIGNGPMFVSDYTKSTLRSVITDLSGFTNAEKALMLITKGYSMPQNGDKLYAPAASGSGAGKTYFTVGSNSNLIKIYLTEEPYSSGISLFVPGNTLAPYTKCFWLRTPRDANSYFAIPGDSIDYSGAFAQLKVLPAFCLNLSSVLFASASESSRSDASLSSDTLTLRYNGSTRIKSSAIVYATGIEVVKGNDSGNVYIYVQGNDGTNDWVWSKEITVNETIPFNIINHGLLMGTKVWLETTDMEENKVYAIPAEEKYYDLPMFIIPNGVLTIGEEAFAGCENLTTIKIPESVTFIDKTAFTDCDNIFFIVSAGSYAEQYCIDHALPYTYSNDSQD